MAIEAIGQVNYTKQGNPYNKTNAGKTTGTILGGIAATTALALPLATGGMTFKEARNAIKFLTSTRGKNLGSRMAVYSNKNLKLINLIKKPLNFMTKTKAGRIATITTAFMLPTLAVIGFGRMLGAGVDKAINSYRMSKADKAAE